jgi:hypothetical protein
LRAEAPPVSAGLALSASGHLTAIVANDTPPGEYRLSPTFIVDLLARVEQFERALRDRQVEAERVGFRGWRVAGHVHAAVGFHFRDCECQLLG